MIRVIINGATGKMGIPTIEAVKSDPELKCVAMLSSKDNLALAIREQSPDVVIDLTTPNSVFENTRAIIEAGVHPVIGTSGLTDVQISELQAISAEKKLGGIIAPNFSIGAILMMRAAKMCAEYLSECEIIEYHHKQKKDAPSGTALKTQNMIKNQNNTSPPIHSIRLPGLLAHQQVIFGSPGETLTIQHDTNNRECFMPGIILSCKKVMTLDSLIYGLEQII